MLFQPFTIFCSFRTIWTCFEVLTSSTIYLITTLLQTLISTLILTLIPPLFPAPLQTSILTPTLIPTLIPTFFPPLLPILLPTLIPKLFPNLLPFLCFKARDQITSIDFSIDRWWKPWNGYISAYVLDQQQVSDILCNCSVHYRTQ